MEENKKQPKELDETKLFAWIRANKDSLTMEFIGLHTEEWEEFCRDRYLY